MNINKRLEKLRELMKENSIDAYIVNTSDPHSSEYLADRYQTRQWITGFTGSAGLAVISMDKAILWTDGRYFVQAEKELEGTEFEMYKMATPGYPTYYEWLRDELEEGSTLAFDGEIYSQNDYEILERSLEGKKINYISDIDLIGELWEDRADMPMSQAFIHEVKYTGKTAEEKLEDVRTMMEKQETDYFLIGSLDDIAWLFNIRGRDIPNNPVLFSYALISRDEAKLFINKDKLDDQVRGFLNEHGIDVHNYEDILDAVENIEENSSLYLEKSKINRLVYSRIPESVKVKSGINFTTDLKARKNPTEIENQKLAYIKDGVALTKYLHWLDTNVGKMEITEYTAQEKLLEFRQEQEDFIEPSFTTISAYKENAAMMHYSASKERAKELKAEGLYLVDSGGQYLQGTTDMTRTVALGEITDEERRDATLTFKGHTNLIKSRFLKGASGHSLDVLARLPLWQEGLDYKCGTGHGIGFLLNVHEGPHSISSGKTNTVELDEGMIMSVEPGVYKEGKHGIRLENIVVVEKDIETDSGQFMKFEMLSYVPIDLRTIDKSLLDQDEIDWLNSYHKEVYEKLSPYMDEDQKEWLKEQTREI